MYILKNTHAPDYTYSIRGQKVANRTIIKLLALTTPVIVVARSQLNIQHVNNNE